MRIIPFLLAILVTIFSTIPISAQIGDDDGWGDEESYYFGVGRSVDKETAFRRACQDSLLQAVENNIQRANFERYEGEIKKIIASEYKKYFSQKPTIINWDKARMKIKGKVQLEKLLGKIKYIVKPEAMQKKVGIIKWDPTLIKVPEEYAPRIRDLVESIFETTLHRYGMKFTTLDALAALHKQEMDESGDNVNIEDFVFRKGTAAKYLIILSIDLTWLKKTDPIDKRKLYYWDTTVSTKVRTSRSAQRFFNFRLPQPGEGYGKIRVMDESEMREKAEIAVRRVCEKMAIAVVKKMRSHTGDNAPDILTIYFSKFEPSQIRKIKRALDELAVRNTISDLDILQERRRIKASMRTTRGTSVAQLQEKITSVCNNHGVHLVLNLYSSGSQVCYFVPKGKKDYHDSANDF